MAKGNSKRKRKSKRSAGVNGGDHKLRPRLNEVQKVLMGKGIYQSLKVEKRRARPITEE